MAHARKQIRDQLMTTLTGLTTTGSRVFNSRVYDHDALPCISVYTLSEELGDESQNKQFRMLNVMVEVRAKAADSLEDDLDKIGAEIEDAIFANGDTTLSNTCKEFDYDGLDIELSGEAEQPFGLMTMRFMAMYRVNKTDVETIIA
nr:phage minor tail protein U [uncultured Mediterranean phage uvMED]